MCLWEMGNKIQQYTFVGRTGHPPFRVMLLSVDQYRPDSHVTLLDPLWCGCVWTFRSCEGQPNLPSLLAWPPLLGLVVLSARA